ncbi:hypothetical protein IPU62_24895 [Pseudogracilibacillus auburnensis]|nr:hypothetical protein [Pseudogracilibacillus auburnensis]
MLCECGGILLVIAIEELPGNLSPKQKINYNRVCDVECQKCGEVYYSQPYDDGDFLNLVKTTKET